MLTRDELLEIMPRAWDRVDTFLEPLNTAMDEFEINSPSRQAAFLAQIAHESGELRYVRELATGEAYEMRKDLGNTEPGDGPKYKGRGLIQITGRDNYRKCGEALGLDLLGEPEMLEVSDLAARSAAWWWKNHGLNELADAENFRRITIRINGGLNGYSQRVAYWDKARESLA